MVKTSKTDRIFKEAAAVIIDEYKRSSYSKESCIPIMSQIGKKRSMGYLIYMEALRPYALKIFNYKRSLFNRYKIKDGKLFLKGELMGILDRPHVLTGKKEKEIIAVANKLGVYYYSVDLFGLDRVFDFLWTCIKDGNPFRFTNLICLGADSRLLELSAIVAHELKVMDDETYATFIAYITAVRSL